MVPFSKSGGQRCLVGSNPTLSAESQNGEVLEWSIRHAWRACVGFPDRGFESHPLRHKERARVGLPFALGFVKINSCL